MKKILAAVLSLLCAASVFAFDNDDSIVRWRGIVGVITAPAVDNPVGGIHGGAGPWSVRSGRASVALVAGNASFEVEGLVLNGGTASGTPSLTRSRRAIRRPPKQPSAIHVRPAL